MTVTTPLPFDIRWLAFLLLYPNLARCMLRWGLQPHAGGAATIAEEIPERQRDLRYAYVLEYSQSACCIMRFGNHNQQL